ncbi:MAG: MFS transporter [Rickettsiales bacterium]|nr:MFS transporter [Rickettsiales bacterium]
MGNINYFNLFRVFILGIASGLPIVLVLSTFSVWLFELDVSKTTIGLFALATVPYSIKFLWSPFVDGISLPILNKLLGHRKSWLIISQIGLITAIILLAIIDHQNHLFFSAIVILVITFFSATQDIIIDAYRIELARDEEQGIFATFVIYGYRIGMLISGAGALFLASYLNWSTVYFIMALIISVISIIALTFPDTGHKIKNHDHDIHKWCNNYLISPFTNFAKNENFILILLFIVLYKFGDAFAGVMTNPFLLENGFNKIDIASIVKTIGLVFTLVGLSVGGVIVAKFNLKNILIFCGIIQALSNLVFCLQVYFPGNVNYLMITIGFENLAGAMGTVAFVAFISKLCNINYTATQYALLSSLAAVGRTVFSSGAGIVADSYNWILFFIISSIVAIPGIIILFFLNDKNFILKNENRNSKGN